MLFFKRAQLWFAGLNRNVKAAFIITAIVVVWVLSGVFFGGNHEQASIHTEAATPSVVVQPIQAESYHRTIEIVARTAPEQFSTLAAEIPAKVTATPVVEGTTVRKDQSILQLDTTDLTAALRSAEAAVKAAQARLESAQKLAAEGLQSGTYLAEREADVAAAQNQLTSAKEAMNNASVRAPFAGRVERVYVEVGDFAGVGDPLVSLLNTSHYLIVGNVSQNDLQFLHQGLPADAKLANGEDVTGTVRFVAQAADEATNTFRVEVLVDGAKYPKLPVGMSATLDIPADETTAHEVPHAALVLNSHGDVGVMLAQVADDGSFVANFFPVDLLADTSNTAWVGGLPAESTLIVRGQNSVTSGTVVQVSQRKSAEAGA